MRSELTHITPHAKLVDLSHLVDIVHSGRKMQFDCNLEKTVEISGNTGVSKGQWTKDNNVLSRSEEGQSSHLDHDYDYTVDPFVALRAADPKNPVPF